MLSALRRLRALFQRRALDADLAEEMQLHLELRRKRLIEQGMAPVDAEREARRRFGNEAAIRQRSREQWGGASIDAFVHDVRYGLRMVRKSPGFSAVAIASLAVGIGASTVLFSLANSFLFRPVHATNPEQIVQVFTSNSRGAFHGGSSYADYETFRQLPVFDGLMASTRASATLSDRAALLNGVLVSGNYFDVLGLRPAHGRFFVPQENQTPGTHPVVVLSHDAWRRHFAADPNVVGQAIELNGHPFKVIGIGPPRFVGTSVEFVYEFFIPAMMQQTISPSGDLLRDRGARAFQVLGRLAEGMTLRQAEAALAVTAGQLSQQDPAAWRDRNGRDRIVTVLPERSGRFAGAAPGATVFIFSSTLAAVLTLLLIACVNVATVLLARASTRRKEIAVRLAIGASRRRVIRQLLTECAWLATTGGVLGLLLAQTFAALFHRFRPDDVPPFDLTLDARIALFGLAASAVTVVLCGLAPALQTTRPDVNAELKDAARVVRVRGLRFGLRSGLVVVQVAVSLALMTSAGLMLRSAQASRTGDPGFRRDNVLNVHIDLSNIPGGGDARARFYQEAVRGVADIPAVDHVALAALIPMDGSNSQIQFRVSDELVAPDINVVGGGYFSLLDIPVMHGREFTASDRRGSPRVAVVNQMMARQHWNGEALGKVLIDAETKEPVEIVGIVRDLRHRSFAEAPRGMVYLPADQRVRPRMTLHVRTAVPPNVIGPAIQKVLHQIDRAAALQPAETMAQFFDRVTTPQRLSGIGAMATALLELSLVVMALYGVIAFAATQRKREIGLRMALGATSRSVIALIMRDGLVLTAAGVLLGIGIGLAGGIALESLLSGVGPADPVSFGSAILVLVLVGAAASYIPARRAVSVDPSTTLRTE